MGPGLEVRSVNSMPDHHTSWCCLPFSATELCLLSCLALGGHSLTLEMELCGVPLRPWQHLPQCYIPGKLNLPVEQFIATYHSPDSRFSGSSEERRCVAAHGLLLGGKFEGFEGLGLLGGQLRSLLPEWWQSKRAVGSQNDRGLARNYGKSSAWDIQWHLCFGKG